MRRFARLRFPHTHIFTNLVICNSGPYNFNERIIKYSDSDNKTKSLFLNKGLLIALYLFLCRLT